MGGAWGQVPALAYSQLVTSFLHFGGKLDLDNVPKAPEVTICRLILPVREPA